MERSATWRTTIAWFALLVLLAFVAAIQIPLNRSFATAWADHHRQVVLDYKAVSALDKHLHALSPDGQPIPLREIEQAVNGGRPLQRDASNRSVYWTDPATGGKAELSVVGSMAQGRAQVFWREPPRESLAQIIVTAVRRLSYILGYAAWAILFLITLGDFRAMTPSRRFRRCNTLLMIAAGSTALSLLGPGYWRAAAEFFDDDAAGFGWIALALSAALLLLAWLCQTREPDDAPRCPHCAYNLTGNTSGRCPECGTMIPE